MLNRAVMSNSRFYLHSPQVSITRCESYEPLEVEEAMKRAISVLPDSESLFSPGETILIKPNLLSSSTAEKGVCTHPSVVRAMIRILRGYGANPVLGDSPGIGSACANAASCGIGAVCEAENVEILEFTERTSVATPAPSMACTSFLLGNPVLEVDGIVNLAKFKTHGLTGLTGSVKNLFGCVSGLEKPRMHFRYQETRLFVKMLYDLCRTVRPRLSIVDGVEAMEGNGPRNGDIRKLSVIIGGRSPYFVDAAAARIVAVDPMSLPITKAGADAGITTASYSEMQVLGDRLEDFIITHFRMPTTHDRTVSRLPSWLVPIIAGLSVPKPLVHRDRCKACSVCAKACPVEAISMSPTAVIDRHACIRCYCCQEMCPHNAITLSRNPFLR